MILVLSLILFILLVLIGKKRGLKTYLCFYLNYLLLIIFLFLLKLGVNATILSLIICILISYISLFFINGNNIKTKSAFISVLITLSIMFILIWTLGNFANIHGFTYDSADAIGIYYIDVDYDMKGVIIGVILICVIGTVIDTAISISTSLNEVYLNNKKITFKELYKSGMNIGRDILSTTINTLFFAFLSGLIAFLFWYYNQSFQFIINYKIVVRDLCELLFAFIGSIIIIPVTSYVASLKLMNIKKICN